MFRDDRNRWKLMCQIFLHFTSCLHHLLRRDPGSAAARLLLLLLQLLPREHRRLPGAQHWLELREHRLVGLLHGTQAGAHGQHPCGHARAGSLRSGHATCPHCTGLWPGGGGRVKKIAALVLLARNPLAPSCTQPPAAPLFWI